MSIVLVIISLVVGVVLVGQDLIDAAKVRGQISQIESFKTAANMFKMKYSCTPGDCKKANRLSLGRDGNGDRYVAFYSGGIGHQEYLKYWNHMSNAGLLDVDYNDTSTGGYYGQTAGINIPESKLGIDGVGVQYGANNFGGFGRHRFQLAGRDSNGGMAERVISENLANGVVSKHQALYGSDSTHISCVSGQCYIFLYYEPS